MGKSIPDRGAVAVEDFIDVVWNRTFEAILLLEHQFQSVALTITLLTRPQTPYSRTLLPRARIYLQKTRTCRVQHAI